MKIKFPELKQPNFHQSWTKNWISAVSDSVDFMFSFKYLHEFKAEFEKKLGHNSGVHLKSIR